MSMLISITLSFEGKYQQLKFVSFISIFNEEASMINILSNSTYFGIKSTFVTNSKY